MSNFKWFGKKIERQVDAIARRALDKVAILTVNTAQRSMETAKHGAKVPPGQGSRGGHPWQKVRRSAPGEAPAAQTGHLRDYTTWEKPSPLVRLVGTNVKYGRRLELGDKGAARVGRDERGRYLKKADQVGKKGMSARPYLMPAFKKNKKIVEQAMKGKL